MPATPALLTGLSLATGVAREATDGVPIVKQVLGVASRIVGLAEQIDQNREDLHALADRAKRMEVTIATVVGDIEPEERLLRGLNALNSVLRAVEKQFEKHIQQGRVRKTLRYIFTVRREVDRLKGEFDDRLRELEVMKIRTRGPHKLTCPLRWLLVSMPTLNARFTGEFRNIRHSEIDLLRRITPPDQSRQGYEINYHLATCEGSNQVVVVREIVQCGQDEEVRQRIEEHDSILERLSLVKNRHPNIAYLYGRNTGPKDSRFVVLKAGDIRSIYDVFGACKAEISVISRIIAKLAVRLLGTLKVYGIDISTKNALCHLPKHGADSRLFLGRETNVYIDMNYEPKIGVQDDLFTLALSPEDHAYRIQELIKLVLAAYGVPLRSQENEFPCAHFKNTTWLTDLFGTLIEAGYRGLCEETVFRRADIRSLIPLSQDSRMYLRQSKSRRTDATPYWCNTLLDMAIGGRKDEGSFLHAEYYGPSWSGEHEYMNVYCIEDTGDVVYHSRIYFKFPTSDANEIREQLGIPACADDQDRSYVTFYLQRFAGTCTGWRRGLPSRYASW